MNNLAVAESGYSARPYQSEAIESIFDKYFSRQPVNRQVVMLPTGMGKTVVFAMMTNHPKMVEHLEQYPFTHQKILVIAHREELLNQAADKIARANPSLRVEIEQADRKVSPMADVIVASVQTLVMGGKRRLKKIDPNTVRVIITDEAHHATAPSYVQIFQHFGCLPPDDWGAEKPTARDADLLVAWQNARKKEWDFKYPNQPLLVGFTATPKRSDRVGLDSVFDEIVYSMNMRDGIAQGWLSALKAIKVSSKTSLDGVSTKAGDFSIGELGDAVNNDDRNALAVKSWLEHARGLQTVAFCVNVEHAHQMAAQFVKEGVKAAAIDGSFTPTERHRVLKGFEEEKIQVVTNCNILTEGFDSPNIQCVLHARPTKSSILYVQMTGRGTRLHPLDPAGPARVSHTGRLIKPSCLIIDLVDVTRRHSLITAPELFGLPPGFDAKGDDLMAVTKKVEKAAKEGVDVSDLASLDDLKMKVEEIDLWTGAFNTELVQKHCSMNWMKESESHYSISIRPRGGTPETVSVAQNKLGQWEAHHMVGGKKVRHIASGDVGTALRKAEDWVAQERGENMSFTNRHAAWRSNPPSPGQIGLARSLGIPIHLAKTSGQLSDMIEVAKRKQDSRKAFRL